MSNNNDNVCEQKRRLTPSSSPDLVFDMYNTAGDAVISRREMISVLTTLAGTLSLARFRAADAGDVAHRDIATEVVRFVDDLFRSFGIDNNNNNNDDDNDDEVGISRTQFRDAVRQHPVLTTAPADVFAALIGKEDA